MMIKWQRLKLAATLTSKQGELLRCSKAHVFVDDLASCNAVNANFTGNSKISKKFAHIAPAIDDSSEQAQQEMNAQHMYGRSSTPILMTRENISWCPAHRKMPVTCPALSRWWSGASTIMLVTRPWMWKKLADRILSFSHQTTCGRTVIPGVIVPPGTIIIAGTIPQPTSLPPIIGFHTKNAESKTLQFSHLDIPVDAVVHRWFNPGRTA